MATTEESRVAEALRALLNANDRPGPEGSMAATVQAMVECRAALAAYDAARGAHG
jgi:hypothetical protein